jgi:hypothetical protein
MATSEQIMASANAQIAALQETERSINQEISTVKDKEWNNPLTDADRAELDDLRATRASVLSAMEEVSFVTMAALDKTDELQRIKNAMVGVIADLRAKQRLIQRIGQIAGKVTTVVTGVQDLSSKLQAFAGQG